MHNLSAFKNPIILCLDVKFINFGVIGYTYYVLCMCDNLQFAVYMNFFNMIAGSKSW